MPGDRGKRIEMNPFDDFSFLMSSEELGRTLDQMFGFDKLVEEDKESREEVDE